MTCQTFLVIELHKAELYTKKVERKGDFSYIWSGWPSILVSPPAPSGQVMSNKLISTIREGKKRRRRRKGAKRLEERERERKVINQAVNVAERAAQSCTAAQLNILILYGNNGRPICVEHAGGGRALSTTSRFSLLFFFFFFFFFLRKE